LEQPLPKFLKAKSTSYGHWLLLVQAVALALVLTASPAAAQTIRLVVLGDSLTAGLGLPPGKAFPDRLQAALRARGWDVDVLNAGVSGDTAADGLARYDWAVPANGDALIVELGANDMLRGLEPAATKKALSAILDKAHGARLPTLIAGMRAAPNLGAEYDRAFDAIYPALARDHDVALYPFFLDGVAGDPKLNQADGMHPTAEGVDAIVERIAPSVEEILKQVKQ
jgi:acyl-CoA thioesterase-1